MASIFHRAAFERPFPVTMLFLELLQQKIAIAQTGSITEQELIPLLERSLIESGLRKTVSQDDVDYVLRRINAMMEEAEKSTPPDPPSKKLSFASAYGAWAVGLDPDALCLAASSYDYFKAAKLYREVDKEDVLWLADHYLRHEWEKIRVGFESVVYGFGGSYKGDSGSGGGESSIFDLTADDDKGLAALKNLL